MTTEEIITGYYRAAAEAHKDVGPNQLRWVFQQAALRLGWEVPELNGQHVRPEPVKADETAIQKLKKELGDHQ